MFILVPDQSPDLILSQIQQLRRIPIHSISFNCADSKANQFLFRLASVTGGRYHYYSEDITDPKGPVTHQSDDLQLLSDEISHAHDQLTQAQQLREACNRLKHPGHRYTYPIPRRKKPKRLSTSDNFVSLSKWIKKNSLSRRNLLLMDALGPTAVPHNPKHVPILDKKVHGKVYEGLLSTAHISGKGNITLVNPSGVDLVSYESKLMQYIEECEGVMERVVAESLPQVKLQGIKEKVGLEGSERIHYKEHKEELREGLRDAGCGSLLSELDKVEAEIKKAHVLISQAAALKEECSGKRKSKKWSSDVSLSSSVSDNSSGTAPTISDLNGGERTINTSIGSPVK
uniref:Uncharacterized protein n=1 Tax=Amphimedon queenslandica TaxID=400682 RepID=A0A1X7TED8_AMPQE